MVSTKKALCVGINKFKNLPKATLQGCVNDMSGIADAKIGGDYHGAFTYFFCKEMRACQNKLSRSELLKNVRADLKQGKYDQVPQLESQATVKNLAIKTE